MFVEDFNAEYPSFQTECKKKKKKIVNNLTCYKSVKNPCCIDLIITNSPMSFQNN